MRHRIRDGSHSSRPCVAAALKQPTRTVTGRNTPALHLAAGRAVPIRPCSGWGLPCRFRCRSRGALLPHPFTLACEVSLHRRYTLCGTFPCPSEDGPAGVTRHPCFVEPGLSSASQREPRPDAAARPPGAGCYLARPRSRSKSNPNRIARISPSISPSMRSGRNRRWNAFTAAWPSAMSYPKRSRPR